MVAHPVAMTLITGGACGVLLAGAIYVIAMGRGEPASAGLVGLSVVAALVGLLFGFFFMKEMRPFMEEALQSETRKSGEVFMNQWRRDHERVRRHPWLWLWLGPVSLANAIYRVLNASTTEGAALYTLIGLAGVLLGLYLIAVWRSPIPPWRRH